MGSKSVDFNKNVENKEQVKDPAYFAYKEEDKVEIKGRVLLQLLSFLAEYSEKNTQTLIKVAPREQNENIVDWLNRSSVTQETYIPLNYATAVQLGSYLAAVHEQNVVEGKATHISELLPKEQKEGKKGDKSKVADLKDSPVKK